MSDACFTQSRCATVPAMLSRRASTPESHLKRELLRLDATWSASINARTRRGSHLCLETMDTYTSMSACLACLFRCGAIRHEGGSSEVPHHGFLIVACDVIQDRFMDASLSNQCFRTPWPNERNFFELSGLDTRWQVSVTSRLRESSLTQVRLCGCDSRASRCPLCGDGDLRRRNPGRRFARVAHVISGFFQML